MSRRTPKTGRPGRLAGKVAVITGGGTGIGRATALLFAAEGAAVALVGRRDAPLAETAAEITQSRGRAVAVRADVATTRGAMQAVEATVEAFGGIDVLVNNAGVPGRARLTGETSDAVWREVVGGNLTSCFRMTRAALPQLVRRGGGAIINVSSILGLVAARGNVAYGVAKAGVIALTRGVAAEYAGARVRCNCVCPGTIPTAMTDEVLADAERRRRAVAAIPMQRLGDPSEIASAILYLGSDESAFVTGAVLTVDGGYTAGRA